ncbi:MAG TPA: DUF5777 family beta-barrel protein [Polyangia bacterium]|jgi:hypothetical protein
MRDRGGWVRGVAVAAWLGAVGALGLTSLAAAQPPPGGPAPSGPGHAPGAPAHPPASQPAGAEPVEVIENPQVYTLWINPENWARIDRVINVGNARATRRRTLQLVIDHRTFEPLQQHAFRDLVGFDAGGLKIGLGLRYGILDGLDVGAYRLSNGIDAFDAYQFDLKLRFLDQRTHVVDAAVRAGGTWFSQQGPTRGGGLVQLLVHHDFAARLLVGTGLLYHSSASEYGDLVTTNGLKIQNRYALAVPALLEWRFQSFLAWDVEAVFNVAEGT